MRRLYLKFFPALFLMTVTVAPGQNSKLLADFVIPTSPVSSTVLEAAIRGNELFEDSPLGVTNQSLNNYGASRIRIQYELSNAGTSKIIHVRFRTGANIDSPLLLLPPELQNSVASIRRLFSLSDQELNRVGAGRLKLWFEITLKPETHMDEFIEKLKLVEDVEVVEQAPRPVPPPSN
jgi:hypothetical protein